MFRSFEMSILKKKAVSADDAKVALTFIYQFREAICGSIEKEKDSPNLPRSLEKLEVAMRIFAPGFTVSIKRSKTEKGEVVTRYDLEAVCSEIKSVLLRLAKEFEAKEAQAKANESKSNPTRDAALIQVAAVKEILKESNTVRILERTWQTMAQYYITMCLNGGIDALDRAKRMEALEVTFNFLVSRGYSYPYNFEGMKIENMRQDIEGKRLQEMICKDLKAYLGESVIRAGKLTKKQKREVALAPLPLILETLVEIFSLTGIIEKTFAHKYFPMRFGTPSFDRDSRIVYRRIRKNMAPKLIENRLKKVLLDFFTIFEYALSTETIILARPSSKNLYIRTLNPPSKKEERRNSNSNSPSISEEAKSLEYDLGLIIQCAKIGSMAADRLASLVTTKEDKEFVEAEKNLSRDTVLIRVRPELIFTSRNGVVTGPVRTYINNPRNKDIIMSMLKRMLLNDHKTNYSHLFSVGNETPPARSIVNFWNEFDKDNSKIELTEESATFHLKRDLIFKLLSAELNNQTDIGYDENENPTIFGNLFNVREYPKRESGIPEEDELEDIVDVGQRYENKLITTKQNALCDKWIKMQRRFLRDIRFQIEVDKDYFNYDAAKDAQQEISQEETNTNDLLERIRDNLSDLIENPEAFAAKVVTGNCYIEIGDHTPLNSKYNQFLIAYQYLFQDIGFSFHAFNKICKVDENARIKYSL